MTLTIFLACILCVCAIVVVFGCYLLWNDKARERTDYRTEESRRREVIYNERSMNLKSQNLIAETKCEAQALQDILSSVSHKKHIMCEHTTCGGFKIIATDFDPIAPQTHMIHPSIISPAISENKTIEGRIIYSDKNFDRIEIKEIK